MAAALAGLLLLAGCAGAGADKPANPWKTPDDFEAEWVQKKLWASGGEWRKYELEELPEDTPKETANKLCHAYGPMGERYDRVRIRNLETDEIWRFDCSDIR